MDLVERYMYEFWDLFISIIMVWDLTQSSAIQALYELKLGNGGQGYSVMVAFAGVARCQEKPLNLTEIPLIIPPAP